MLSILTGRVADTWMILGHFSFSKIIITDRILLMKNNDMTNLQIDIPLEKIRTFCLKNHIRKLALFGSVLTNHFRKKSDVDILVEFDSKFIPGLIGVSELEYELATIIGRTVDLRTPKDLSPYFRNDVISEAYHLYGKERFSPS